MLVTSVLQLQEPERLNISWEVRLRESGAVLEVFTLAGIYSNSTINKYHEYDDSTILAHSLHPLWQQLK